MGERGDFFCAHPVPEGVQVGKASVIGYVQDQRSMRILGAFGVDLGSRTGS